jgi:hypothetical protein
MCRWKNAPMNGSKERSFLKKKSETEDQPLFTYQDTQWIYTNKSEHTCPVTTQRRLCMYLYSSQALATIADIPAYITHELRLARFALRVVLRSSLFAIRCLLYISRWTDRLACSSSVIQPSGSSLLSKRWVWIRSQSLPRPRT